MRYMVRMFAAVALLLPLAHAIPAASPAALAFAPRMNGPHQSAQLRGPTPALALQALRGGKPAPAPPAPAPRGSSMLVRVGIMLGMYAAMCVAENLIADKLLAHPSAPSFLSALVAPSHLLGGMVSASYGLVILVNVVGSSFMMVYLSFIPGAARRKYTELAKKKGDRDAEARYSAPKLYAEGFSQEAKEYNCAQRAHQQALETYANFVVCSVIGGVRQPLLTSLAGVLYIISRVKWAQGYATGDPMNRYAASGGWGKHIWTSLLVSFVCAASTGLGVMGIV